MRCWGITCDLCHRREQFAVEALKAQHGGDVKMPDLLSRLVSDRPRQQQKSFSVYDRCRAMYDRASPAIVDAAVWDAQLPICSRRSPWTVLRGGMGMAQIAKPHLVVA